MVNKYIVGVVTYNPDIKKLYNNFEMLLRQNGIEQIIVVDNGSKNYEDIKRLKNNGVTILIRNEENLGIARALNMIMERAEQMGYTWVLTCDQDSVMPEGSIHKYSEYVGLQDIGIICPVIYDTNAKSVVHGIEEKELTEVEKCITSGSFNSIKVWKEVGGFDEFMFIDGVDFEYCERVKSAGYKIVRVNEVIMNHEIGKSTIKKFPFELRILNHSPVRKYYITRNRIYCDYKRYKKMRIHSVMAVIWELILIVFYESEKRAKVRATIKGFMDGIKCGRKLYH